MIGPKTEENMNSEILVVVSSKTNTSDEEVFTNTERKTFCDQIDSMDNEDQNACAKKRKTEEDCLKRQEVLVLNGNWDSRQTISKNTADTRSIKIYALDGNELCIPLSESGVTEITVEDINSIFKQVSERASCTDLNTVFSESIPLTEHSDTEYKHINDTENNCDYNLSWLINFKVGALFNADEVKHDHNYKEREVEEITCPAVSRSTNPGVGLSSPGFATTKITAQRGRSLLSPTDLNVTKQQTNEHKMKVNRAKRCSGLTKPPFTYTELIEEALQEKGELTVSEIYQWISDHFPFYKANDDRWKNSVRHNLSISPHFRKGGKAPHGAGHLWTIANKHENFQKTLDNSQHMQQFMSNNITTDEVERATASIEDKENHDFHTEMLLSINAENCTEEQETSGYTPLAFSPQQCISLKQSAEEILSGIRKNVEVQYLNPVAQESQTQTDFLNPVPMDVAVEESGLLENVDDMETELGLLQNMDDMEVSHQKGDLNADTLMLTSNEAELNILDTIFSEELHNLRVDDKTAHLICGQNAATPRLTTDDAELSIFDTIFSEQLDNLYNELITSSSQLQV